jgi:hypothetical protein
MEKEREIRDIGTERVGMSEENEHERKGDGGRRICEGAGKE